MGFYQARFMELSEQTASDEDVMGNTVPCHSGAEAPLGQHLKHPLQDTVAIAQHTTHSAGLKSSDEDGESCPLPLWGSKAPLIQHFRGCVPSRAHIKLHLGRDLPAAHTAVQHATARPLKPAWSDMPRPLIEVGRHPRQTTLHVIYI